MKASPESKIMTTTEIPMPSTVEGIVGVIRRTLGKDYIQSIHLSIGRPIEVVWYRDIDEVLSFEEVDESPDVTLARIEINELEPTEGASPSEILLECLGEINEQGLRATHMFCGSLLYLKGLFGIPRSRKLPKENAYVSLFNVKVLEVPSIPDDAIVILASENRSASVNEVKNGFRVTL